MRRTVIDVERPAETHRLSPNAEKRWWQTCSIPEFKERIAAGTQLEAEGLLVEIKGACLAIGVVVSDTSRDSDHRKRARAALAFATEKKLILTQFLTHQKSIDVDGRKERHARRSAKRNETFDVVRKLVRDGQIDEAVLLLVDWFSGALEDDA